MIRFYNCRVMPLKNNSVQIINAEVWTDNDKIKFVGVPAKEQLEGAAFEREIDLKGNLLMPAFKNAHTHTAMTFLRSFADDLPLQEWLFDRVFPMEDKLNEEYVYHLTKLGILEYLTSGISAGFDMYFFKDSYAKACEEIGFRSVLCGAVSGGEESIVQLEDEYKRFTDKSPLIGFMPGFHAEYTADIELIKAVGEFANKYKTPVAMHNSETEKEVRECVEKYGLTPTALFEREGIYNYGGAGFHCVHMSDEDLAIFKKRGVYAVHCPGSNVKLASGIAPITKMQDMGINLALGTDGPASNNALDMFREMHLMTVLQKIRDNNAAACPADTALLSATVGGARAMGLKDCDCIAEGKQADVIVIDLNRPNMQPLNNIAKNVVYSGSKENVRLTMIAGKILYENGEFFVGEDAERIYSKANEIINTIK